MTSIGQHFIPNFIVSTYVTYLYLYMHFLSVIIMTIIILVGMISY